MKKSLTFRLWQDGQKHFDFLRCATGSVSYTHLDVYNRQDIVEVDDYIAEFVVEGNNERAFISMNTQNIVRLEVDLSLIHI